MRPILSILSVIWLPVIAINPTSNQVASFDCIETKSRAETKTCISADLIGKWEPYSTAFYKTGIIKIPPHALCHESCKSKFKFFKNIGAFYYFHSDLNGTCHFISDQESIEYIKVIVNSDDITVRFYSGLAERTLLGEGT